MKHESWRKKYFKTGAKRLALLLAPAPGVLALLTVLCLVRSLLPGTTAAALALPQAAPALLAQDVLQASEPEQPGAPSASAEAQTDWDAGITLTVLVGEEEQTMTLQDYLWGVVAAEMPASFEPEALRAQVIAARTYTIYKMLHHTTAHAAQLCTDCGCCQAWISRADRLASWGEDGQVLEEKLTAAVADTDGLAALYDGEPIQAVFHAASDGVTRSAGEVWGSEVPYLQSVSSPEGEEVPNYYSVTGVSAADFCRALAGQGCDFTGDSAGWIGDISYDEAGLSDGVSIGGVSVPTATLRTLFSLRSSSMTVEVSGDTVNFYVTGYGHGVGMSQYGANALAAQGFLAQEIICWYYSGVSVENLADKALDLG